MWVGKTRLAVWKLMFTIAATGGVNLVILFFPIDWQKMEDYWGYIGVFAGVTISSIGFIPGPSIFLVTRAGLHLDPFLLGIIAGVGSALGEINGYIIGISGRSLVQQSRWYEKISRWIKTYGFSCILVLAFIPNPLFDVAGGIAGAARYPLWRFFLASAIGKTLKFILIAGSTHLLRWGCEWLFMTCEFVQTSAGAR